MGFFLIVLFCKMTTLQQKCTEENKIKRLTTNLRPLLDSKKIKIVTTAQWRPQDFSMGLA